MKIIYLSPVGICLLESVSNLKIAFSFCYVVTELLLTKISLIS